MSIELPGWVADAFNLVGLPWPGIDEDQLRAWAHDVRSYAAEISALSGKSWSAVAALSDSGNSSFGQTLVAQWERHHALISALHGPMEGFADALDVAADAVVAQKLLVIGAAVALAGEVIATQGEALVTFGLAEAEVPAEVAIARLAVKAALQELEGQLLGLLINKAAAEIGSLLGGTIGKLVTGGGQVAAEAVALKADYSAMQTLATALTGHADGVEQVSSVSWRKASGGSLEEGGPGGGWREVARAVEQVILQVLKQLFVDLGRALWTIIKDTIDFLKKAIAALRHTDSSLASKADRLTSNAGGGGREPPGTPGPGRTGGEPPLPQGLTAEQFAALGSTVRAGAGHIGDGIFVQGSRAAGTARPDSDIDLMIRVTPERFDELISQRFKTPNPGSAKERTMLWAISTGKIQAGEAGLSRVRRALEDQLGMDVDLSIVRQGGPFDTPPFIEVPGNG